MEDKNDIVTQMVNAIADKADNKTDKSEEELRKNLSMRAMEYFMFADDDE